MRSVASLVPAGAVVRESVKDGKAWPRAFVGSRQINPADLMPRAHDWLAAMRHAAAATEATGAAKVEGEQ